MPPPYLTVIKVLRHIMVKRLVGVDFFPFEYYRLVHKFQLKNSYAPNLSKIWWDRFVYSVPPLICSSRVLIEFVLHISVT